jgi:hypothetical protein
MCERYKELYNYEMIRKDKLNDKISTAMLFITLYIAGTNLVLDSVSQHERNITFGIVVGVGIVSVILFIVSLYFGIRTFYGYTYNYLGAEKVSAAYSAHKLYYMNNYDKYFASNGIPEQELVEKDFVDELANTYLDAASTAFKNNNKKSKNFTLFSYYIIISLVMIAVDVLVLNIHPLIMERSV